MRLVNVPGVSWSARTHGPWDLGEVLGVNLLSLSHWRGMTLSEKRDRHTLGEAYQILTLCRSGNHRTYFKWLVKPQSIRWPSMSLVFQLTDCRALKLTTNNLFVLNWYHPNRWVMHGAVLWTDGTSRAEAVLLYCSTASTAFLAWAGNSRNRRINIIDIRDTFTFTQLRCVSVLVFLIVLPDGFCAEKFCVSTIRETRLCVQLIITCGTI